MQLSELPRAADQRAPHRSALRFGGGRLVTTIDAKWRARFALVASASRGTLIMTKR
jgi:hypothetical protein